MDHKVATALAEMMQNAGYDAHIYEGYSGRGMFGKQTTGLVVGNVMDLITILYEDSETLVRMREENDLPETLDGTFQTDNLAMDTIIY